MNKREVRRRIRELVAAEIRITLSILPDSLDNEPKEVQAAWQETVWDIADRIHPERKGK